MSFWNFLGGFALFSLACDVFSSKPKRAFAPKGQHYYDYYHEDCCDYNHKDYQALSANESGMDVLQNRIDELQIQLDNTNVMSDRYDELQDRIDELQDRIDSMEEWEDDIQDELDDLRDELDDLEFDRDLYDNHDDW